MKCDICHEETHSDFFCDECCNEPVLEEIEAPIMQWKYYGPDTEIRKEYLYYCVCKSCCRGHAATTKGAD